MRVSRKIITSLILVLALAFPSWAATYTGDQGGADLILADGDYIHGSISNVRRFLVPAGATVHVTPWNGSQYGQVAVSAGEINVAGVIDASLAVTSATPVAAAVAAAKPRAMGARQGGRAVGVQVRLKAALAPLPIATVQVIAAALADRPVLIPTAARASMAGRKGRAAAEA